MSSLFDKPGAGATARTRGERGFTLIELMVVLVILAMLAAIAAPRVTKYLRRAKWEAAKVQVDALEGAVEGFHLDTGRFPTQDEGLQVLVQVPKDPGPWSGPYIKKQDSLTDPWGRPYHYRYPGQHGDFDVYSLGADNKEGGDGDDRDVGNW